MKPTFEFWVKYLKYSSLFFMIMGGLWAIIGSLEPFGIFDTMMSQSFFGKDQLSPETIRVQKFLLVPFGATAVGYFIFQYLITIHAFAKKEKWAYNTIAIANIIYWSIDAGLTLYHEAYFNTLLTNIPYFLAMAPVLIFSRKFFD